MRLDIFGRLRSARQPAPAAAAEIMRAAVPEGVRIYAIGDVHGRADLLAQLHQAIIEDGGAASKRRKVVIYLGDYVDRGLDSSGVIELLLQGLPDGFEPIYLKGNHEDAFLKFLDGTYSGRSWKRFGGAETMLSYGVKDAIFSDTREAHEAARAAMLRTVPEAHLAFLRRLELWVQVGDYFFTHAGVKPGRPLNQQSPEDLMWIREEFLNWSGGFGKVIIHGHTPEDAPVVQSNRIGIDTAAYVTGVLTALVLDGDRRRFIQTKERG